DADAERIDFFEPVRDRERFVDAHLAASDARADVECALGGICGRCDRHQHEDEWKRSHRVDLPCSCTPEDDAKLGACPARLQGWAFECRKTVLRGSDLATSTAGAAQRRRIDPTHEYSCLTRAPSPEPQNVRHCMSETAAIIEALKRDLKRRGLTYRDLAKKVGLSEASVKRVFASKSFTLQRLESMCAAVGTSVSELVRSAGTAQDFGAYSLTLEQEELLASDRRLLACFYLILNNHGSSEIQKKLQLSECELRALYVKLDAAKLIELQPRLKVRLRTGPVIAWRADGPVYAAYEKMVKTELLQSEFQGTLEAIHFRSAEL